MHLLLRSKAIAVATSVFIAATAVAGGLAFAGSELLQDRRATVPIVLVVACAGAFALLGWAMERARREELETRHAEELGTAQADRARREAALREEADRARGELTDLRTAVDADRAQRDEVERDLRARLEGIERALEETRGEYEARLDTKERELAQERRARTRTEQSRREAKEWADHLRHEITQIQRERGALGDTGDFPRLVLRTALTLVGARKGLLLSREDEDGDRLLDVVCHEGFEHDPTDSALAQRFAGEVIEADRTIREDDEPDLAPERRTPADSEIRNVLAIPMYVTGRFAGAVVLANRDGGFEEYDDEVLLALGDHAGAVLQNSRLQQDLRTSYVGTVRVLAGAIEAKDRFLRGHAEAVSAYVASVADRLGLEPRRREELVWSSLLHDVGKIGISERILLKPGALTPEERSLVQLHPRIGYRLVQQVPALHATELAILHHHEHWDGNGYPAGLEREDIPLEARIVAVADAFSAMTADRPYRSRMSVAEACAELERCAGAQFDPVVVHLFVEEVRKHPPSADPGDALETALADPQLDAFRDGEPILGAGSFALTDSLTLLYARRHLDETAHEEALRAAVQDRPFAVLLAELADIADVNRREGYDAGDAAIRRVAGALQAEAVRFGGTACRYSGRRLGVVLPGREGTAEACAAAVAARLADGPAVRITSAVWRPGDSGEAVIARARAALGGPPAPEPAPQAPEYPGFQHP